MLLFVFDGASLLLRFADRQFLALLFQLPPRLTRFEPTDETLKYNFGRCAAFQTMSVEFRSGSARRLPADALSRLDIVFLFPPPCFSFPELTDLQARQPGSLSSCAGTTGRR